MALVGINPVQKQPKESTLDKILKGIQIAQGVMGTAIAIPKFMQDRNIANKELDLKQQQIDVENKKLNQPNLSDEKLQMEIDRMKKEDGQPTEEDKQNFNNIWKGRLKLSPNATKGEVTTYIKMGSMNDADVARLAIAMGNFNLAKDAADRAARKEAADAAERAKPSQAQLDSAGYAVRAEAADAIAKQLENVATDSSTRIQMLSPREAQTPEFQKLDQAQRDFVNAILRPESGSAISEAEFQNARLQYFPQPGDKPEVIAQKAASRLNKINALKAKSGENAIKAVKSGGVAETLSGGNKQDPQIMKWAQDHNLPYDQAAAIIAKRKASGG